MERFESDKEIIVTNRFKQALIQSDLILYPNDKWESALFTNQFDIVIYRGVYPLAVIEVNSGIENQNLLATSFEIVRAAILITNSRYGIVTDNKQFFLYDRNNRKDEFIETSFSEIINKLLHPEKISISTKDKEIVQNLIIESAIQYLQDDQEFLKFLRDKSFINKIQFDQNSNSYYFSDDDSGITSFENQFFIKMFGEFKETEICRYTTLHTIFEMLNNISFRMSGLVGMNDKSEVNYVETYLNKGDNQISFTKPLIKEHYNTIKAVNNRYITSCSNIERKDDLTLWRLYSDDAKGVCLIFNVKKNNLNKHILLQKVKYADRNGKHKELDFLKQIMAIVKIKTGFKFEFKKIGYWKHFFKAKDYKIEEEIRLLIIDNSSLPKLKTDWVMTYNHSIFNPVIDFQLNSKSFPIQLKEILLGPKCPEQETNFVQLAEMIRRKKNEIITKSLDSNLKGVKVKLSQIRHYR